ncbi:hypothetical protein DPMN_069751 [Dreissena polymorpha]|uniref:Uncharacterized protein n=1 Tax=Dreissena polymorpha TaxID=45954 RepID=A0A9D3Z4S0_DREPO|nr:hypothetical protein DPMN_069751 [Dreissena polymorpha]
MIRDSTGMNRGRPGTTGAPPGKFKLFNTSGMNRESPGRTGNDRRGTGINWDGTGNNQDGTVAQSGPIQTPTELRQRPGCRRCFPGECRQSTGIATVHRYTGALPGRHRHSARIRLGITGDDRG